MSESTIHKVHAKVEAVKAVTDEILELQKKSHLSPLWVTLMVIGAFTLGGWLF